MDREYDLVVFSMGSASEKYSYPRAFDIAQDLRICAKAAMHYENQAIGIHRDLTYNNGKAHEFAEGFKKGETAERRRSRVQPTNRTGVGWRGSQVFLVIGNTTIGFHWRDALTVSGWFRIHAKAAKQWAGDTSKRFRIRGLLTNRA